MVTSSSSSSSPPCWFTLSFFSQKPPHRKTSAAFPLLKTPFLRAARVKCHKMYVPGFGEASPEAKAANNLHNFFSYVAVRIVSAQLEDYNPEAYQDLMEFLSTNSVNDGDKFIADLMRKSSNHKTLALRILEVRSAYSKNDFEWDNMKRLAFKMVDESNTRLMRDYVLETSHADTQDTDKYPSSE